MFGNDRPQSPVFSIPSGMYNNPFELSLSSEKGTQIYYSLDGSSPETDGILYTEPITVYDRSGEVSILRLKVCDI